LKCRFGNEKGNFMFERAIFVDPTHIKCSMPNYP